MKQLINLTLILIFSIHCRIYSQCISTNTNDPCCNELINIDPLNSQFTVNTERLTLANVSQRINFSTFDLNWLDINSITVSNPYPKFKLYSNLGSGAVRNVNNPIFLTSPEYKMITNYNPNTNNSIDDNPMHPKYGWQLMHAYTGYKPFTSSMASPILMPAFETGYHYMFYNRHTGDVRFFTSVEFMDNHDPAKISLNLEFLNADPSKNSALFNHYNSRMLSLSDTTRANMAKGFFHPNSNYDQNHFNTTDFKFDYDPCICDKSLNQLAFKLMARNQLNIYAEGKYAGIIPNQLRF